MIPNHKQTRFVEIDVIRGVALILMLIYHLVFDLVYFNYLNIDIDGVFWQFLARISLVLFLLLVGVGMSLRTQKKTGNRKNLFDLDSFKPYLRRALVIFLAAMMVTVISKVFLGDNYVRFGVLHLIAVSLIIFYPLRHFRWLNLFLGVGFVLIGNVASPILAPNELWLPLGMAPADYTSVDYVPVIPWGACVLWGIFLGHSLYKNHERQFRLPKIIASTDLQKIAFNGRQTLVIYLIHQPVYWGVFALLNLMLEG